MSLSFPQMLTLGVTVAYLGVSAIHLKEGRKVLALASLGYSLAATGMILAEKNSS